MDNVFNDNPSLKVYFKTSDGTPFYNESDAKNHARSLENNSVKKVERGFSDDSKKDKNTPSEMLDYREAIKAIQAAETLEQLEQFKGYPQPSVIKALEEKTTELTANIEVVGVTVEGANQGDNQNQ